MIIWLGHSSVRIAGEKQIALDPFLVKKGTLKADLILITHHHEHHCSPENIARIIAPHTTIVANALTAPLLKQCGGTLIVAKAGDILTIDGTEISAVPAYTTGRTGHPRSDGGLGFIVTAGGKRIYHAGDTDLIPEMSTLKCDIALLPVSGGDACMDALEAVRAAELLKPTLALPMHYGSITGSIADAQLFCRTLAARNIPVKLLTPP